MMRSVLLTFAGLAMTASVSATDRLIVASVEVQATPEQIWEMWTTEDGLSFFAPASNVDLRPGGDFELYFLPDAPEGQRGSEGTTILGYQENRMLTVTWALPPYMPEVRPHLTPLTLDIIPVDEVRTRVTLTHTGWGEGGEWDAAYSYFQENWPAVLQLMAEQLQSAE